MRLNVILPAVTQIGSAALFLLLALRPPHWSDSGIRPAHTLERPRGAEDIMGSSMYNNASGKGWIVQKFGGTSVGKFPDRVSCGTWPLIFPIIPCLCIVKWRGAGCAYVGTNSCFQIARDIVK